MANRNKWRLDVLQSRPEYQEYHSQLLEAFKKDCETLLLEFAGCKTFKFETFADIWQKMHFSLIYRGQNIIEESVMFPEACFFAIKKYIIFSPIIFIKVGAFYMLYGLYYKQPFENKVPIRWTSEEYFHLNSLASKMDLERDFMFIFNKMKFDGAFSYVIKTRPWGMDFKLLSLDKTLKDDIFNKNEYPALVKSAVHSDDCYGIEMLKNVTEEYEQELDAYLKENPKVRLDFEKSTLVQDIEKICDGMDENKWQTSDSMKKEESIVNRRRDIKRKAQMLYNVKSEDVQN